MAPVALDWRSNNLVPVVYFSVAAAGSVLLLTFISSIIWRSPAQLPPLSNTRQHERQRRKHVLLFGALASTSFLLVLYYAVARYTLSYSFWVDHHGRRQEIPNTLPGRSYTPANLDDSLQLGSWFASQNVPLQFYEIIAERSRRFWWGQQYFAGLIAWSAFVGVEGHRRRLSAATKVTFVLVAQFLSLSVAQNLFYITLLLKPVPYTSQDALHTPNPATYIVFALLGFFFTADLPLRHHTVLFNGSLFGGLIAVPVLLVTLPDIIPGRFKITHKSVHLAHESYANVFASISVFALASHAWFTGVAVLDNTPDVDQHHRSFLYWPFFTRNSQPDSTRLQRAETAIAGVLGALGDHPAVNAVGWDVLISALSLGIWSIVRGVDVEGMVKCSIWPWHSGHSGSKGESHIMKHVSFDRATKEEDDDIVQPSPAKKFRGRPKKIDDDASVVTKTASKAANQVKEAISGSPGRPRRRTKARQPHDAEDDAEDESYVPDQTTAAGLANLEHEPEHGDGEAESGALAWGLWVLGGLGVATAGALGSEVVEA